MSSGAQNRPDALGTNENGSRNIKYENLTRRLGTAESEVIFNSCEDCQVINNWS
jgi:hypothetical protein